MNYNIQSNSIVNYKPCIKCKKSLTRAGGTFCKDCKPKKESIRTLNKSQSKAYLGKFEVNISSCDKETAKGKNILVPKFVCSRYSLKKELSIQKNTNNIFTLYWSQFNDFNGYLNFIANSGQASSMYYLYNPLTIHQKPKYHQIVISKQDIPPLNLSTIHIIVPIPISRPLYLLKQKSYWEGLIASYFKNVHPMAPLFSIHSINLKTAEKSLLSAIYYGGFQFMQDKPSELIKYFNEYAEHNIKEIIRYTSLQNAQAAFIYSFLMLLSGNFKLFKACQAHVIGMSYLLGINLNFKGLNSTQQYNRFQLFSTTSPFHIAFCGMENLTLNQLTELDNANIELLLPEYQTPNQNAFFILIQKI